MTSILPTARLGVIVSSGNRTVEPYFNIFGPSNLGIYATRMHMGSGGRNKAEDIVADALRSAELLADGHIHVYGALRGRALAGASGDITARIFCKRFEPDLVAIAGCYKVADAIDEGLVSKPVVVRLDNDNLLIELQE